MILTPYAAFKRCLLDGILTHKVCNIAAMIMADGGNYVVKENWAGNFVWDYKEINNWLTSMNMPTAYLTSSVSVYLATYYPLTYQAFLDGQSKDVLRGVIMKEKKKKNSSDAIGHKEGRYYQRKKDSAVFTIRARSLSKNYDWKTVK